MTLPSKPLLCRSFSWFSVWGFHRYRAQISSSSEDRMTKAVDDNAAQLNALAPKRTAYEQVIEAYANEIAVTATLTIARLADRVAALETEVAKLKAKDKYR